MAQIEPTARRPLTSRNTAWAGAIARTLVKWGVSPNAISVASVGFAVGAAGAFWSARQSSGGASALWLIGAAAMIQGRLLCNLFDGMVAIEGGRKTKSGEIYNELPDRIADPIILIGAGYAPGTEPLWGWAAAVMALLTAYVRALGVAAGASQQFCGPMAKPQRMAAATVGSVAQAGLMFFGIGLPVLNWALALICAGSALTVARRTHRIVRELENK